MKLRCIIVLSLPSASLSFQLGLRSTISSLARTSSQSETLVPPQQPLSLHVLSAAANDKGNVGDDKIPRKKSKTFKKKSSNSDSKKPVSKEELVKAIGEQMRNKRKPEQDTDSNLFDILNPFKAGQKLRKTIDGAITAVNTPKDKSIYYVGDRLLEEGVSNELDRFGQADFVPEVLVVGATGEVGRLVVRRLLQDGRFRVRVLVRDLYTETLNLLGTGVTYCQGDLSNTDSLEYALTDVDKIVFCAGAPRPDEGQFQDKFKAFMKETLSVETSASSEAQLETSDRVSSDSEWEQLDSVLQVRAQLAEQVDLVGLQNLLHAYHNVRHADYGTSQTAKRSLFRFQDRPDDLNLFSIDIDDREAIDNVKSYQDYEDYDVEKYDEDASDIESETAIEGKMDAKVTVQAQWTRNQFEQGIFFGKVPRALSTTGAGGEAAVVSTRLRSRVDPDNGIDLSAGFGGFILRLCSDGGRYEMFVRTREYYDKGVEYVYDFSTATKPTGENVSPNKFITVRCPFEEFRPVAQSVENYVSDVPPFQGQDVRNIGFRYRASNNDLKSKLESKPWASFYLALSYVKLYRSQPEPEIVYLSDARIPPVVRSSMVSHATRQILVAEEEEEGVRLLDESMKMISDMTARSAEETYFKFRGEEMIKKSGLNYSIIRVSGFNESPSGELSTIDLRPDNSEVTAVSRTDVAQVCVSALLDPNALNKSFYMGRKKVSSPDENITSKLAALPRDKFGV